MWGAVDKAGKGRPGLREPSPPGTTRSAECLLRHETPGRWALLVAGVLSRSLVAF